nr:MAG TPA: hypothetical protein [Caudoviricetes sp.]
MAGETLKAQMIIPEVMGQMINAKIEALLKITPYDGRRNFKSTNDYP